MSGARYLVDRLWPEAAFELELDAAFAAFDLPSLPDRPLVGLNMVTSLDGRAQRSGTAEGLAGRADRRLMRLLRSAFDAVVSGSGTLRAAGLWTWLPPDLAQRRQDRGLPPQPLGVLLGAATPVDTAAGWFAGPQPRLVILGARAAASQEPLPPGSELLVAAAERPDPQWVLEQLGARGVRSVLLEGGPHVNASFLAAGLVDELYWTIGPLLLGGEALPMIASAPAPAEPRPGRLVSVHRHGDELFLRYRFV